MVYTAKSDYEYITGVELEDLHVYTYLTISAAFTEAAVMQQVSQAERWVNEYCGQSFTAGAAPDGVKAATLEMARHFMNQQLLNGKYIEEYKAPIAQIEALCKVYLVRNKVTPDYSGSDDLFHLPTLRG